MRLFFKVPGVCIWLLMLPVLPSPRKVDISPGSLKLMLVRQADSLANLAKMLQRTPAGGASERLLQQRFKQLRLAYKRIEWAAEYFAPSTARRVNGPPVPETDLSGLVTGP